MHSVTVTRTTMSTTTTSAIILNTGFFKAFPGLLKLLQLLIGIIVVGIIANYFHKYYGNSSRMYPEADMYLFLVSVALMITTFIIILSCVLSIPTATLLPKTMFEYLYHGFAFILYLSAGIAYLAELLKRNDHGRYQEYGYQAKIAAASLGLVNALLYLITAVMSYRVYRIA